MMKVDTQDSIPGVNVQIPLEKREILCSQKKSLIIKMNTSELAQ